MGIAAGMKDIVQDLVSSHETRIAEVKGLKKEANEMLGSFKASQDKMGTQLRKDLARDKAKMRGEVKTMRSGFQSSHKEMGLALKKDLAEHNRAVTDEAAKMRQEIGASHQNMSAKLRRNLAQGAATLKSKAHVIFNDFQRSRKRASAQLRKDLASYDHSIKSEVSGMRQETLGDLREARTAWQGLASTMPAKRSGAEILPKAEAPVAKEEIPYLEAKLLAAVNKHPAGMTLTEIADSLGVALVVLGRTVKSLVDKAEIRKEEKLYFPVSAE